MRAREPGRGMRGWWCPVGLAGPLANSLGRGMSPGACPGGAQLPAAARGRIGRPCSARIGAAARVASPLSRGKPGCLLGGPPSSLTTKNSCAFPRAFSPAWCHEWRRFTAAPPASRPSRRSPGDASGAEGKPPNVDPQSILIRCKSARRALMLVRGPAAHAHRAAIPGPGIAPPAGVATCPL